MKKKVIYRNFKSVNAAYNWQLIFSVMFVNLEIIIYLLEICILWIVPNSVIASHDSRPTPKVDWKLKHMQWMRDLLLITKFQEVSIIFAARMSGGWLFYNKSLRRTNYCL